jgi:hypothetical protein
VSELSKCQYLLMIFYAYFEIFNICHRCASVVTKVTHIVAEYEEYILICNTHLKDVFVFFTVKSLVFVLRGTHDSLSHNFRDI